MLTDQFETDLREALFRQAQEVPADVAARVRDHRYHPRGPGRYLVMRSAAVVVIVSGVVAAAALSQPSRAAHPSWRLVSDLGQAWQGSQPTSLQDGVSLTCPTAQTCYARVFSPPGPGSVSSTLTIEVTHDSGATWQQADLPADVTQDSGQFGPIDCLSEDTCMTLVSSTSWNYEIAETTDGGQSWMTLPGPTQLSTQFAVEGGISCTSSTSCVLIGSYAVGTSEVGQWDAEVTTDGEQTWTQEAMPSSASGGVQCFAGGNCITAGDYSTDSGLRWSRGSLPSGLDGVWSMSCGDSSDCIADATSFPTSKPAPPSCDDGSDCLRAVTEVIVTTDGGQSWTRASASGFASHALPTVTCATASTCWAAGAIVQTPGGVLTMGGQQQKQTPVLESTGDEGQSWQAAGIPAGYGITGVGNVSCSATTSCFAIAQSSNGLVLLSYRN